MQLQVGVKALIQNKQGDFLFLQRRQPLSDGTIRWDIPGGRITPGEALHEALRREISEETNLSLTGKPELLEARDIIIPHKNLHVVRLVFSSIVTGDIMLSKEHSDHAWLPLSEALTINVDQQLLQTLTEYARRSKNSLF